MTDKLIIPLGIWKVMNDHVYWLPNLNLSMSPQEQIDYNNRNNIKMDYDVLRGKVYG
jgi:hypothetical protein